MTHSNAYYRTFLLVLATLTFFFLSAAALTLIFLSDVTTTTTRALKTGPSAPKIITRSVESSTSQSRMIQADDLRQFSRMLYGISLERDARNTSDKPIPYFLQEEGKNSIIYFHGEVPIRCWLEMSTNTTEEKRCPEQIKNAVVQE